MKSKKSIAILLAVFIAAWPVAASDHDDPSLLFSKAFDLFRLGYFTEAAEAFDALEKRESASPGSSIAADAGYLGVIALLNSGDADGADRAAERFLVKYPSSPKVKEVKFQAARAAFMLGRYREALGEFYSFMSEYPSSENFAQALFWHSESLYLLGRGKEAAEGYRRILSDFPESPHRNTAGWRLEVIGIETREARLARLLEFERRESYGTLARGASAERWEEHVSERAYYLIRRLRSAYGLNGSWKLPLYVDKPKEILPALAPKAEPLPSPVLPAVPDASAARAMEEARALMDEAKAQAQANALELLRLSRLNDLLAAKNAALRLLAAKLEAFAAEVSK
jgi:outer membrane protein assembly factor BamD (BamD/ComL family)